MSNYLMQFFWGVHLPEDLREINRPVEALARQMNEGLPNNAEKTVGLRKLIEAREAFFRAKLAGEMPKPLVDKPA